MIIKGKQRKGQCIDMLIYPTMIFYSRNKYIYIYIYIYILFTLYIGTEKGRG